MSLIQKIFAKPVAYNYKMFLFCVGILTYADYLFLLTTLTSKYLLILSDMKIKNDFHSCAYSFCRLC